MVRTGRDDCACTSRLSAPSLLRYNRLAYLYSDDDYNGGNGLLRKLFGEQPREWTGAALETVQAMESFTKEINELAMKHPERSSLYVKYGIWAKGLLRSFDELEQSCYAAKRYALEIIHTHLDEITPFEQISYNRHVYYDKNAYIRVFALLDKLGIFLNEVLELRTERVKTRFSYFTVLRNMRENRLQLELMKPLNKLKDQHQVALNRLRDRRNLEIHQMNAEMRDDLQHSLAKDGTRRTLENLTLSMNDLDEGWEVVQQSLDHSFKYACKLLRNWK